MVNANNTNSKNSNPMRLIKMLASPITIAGRAGASAVRNLDRLTKSSSNTSQKTQTKQQTTQEVLAQRRENAGKNDLFNDSAHTKALIATGITAAAVIASPIATISLTGLAAFAAGTFALTAAFEQLSAGWEARKNQQKAAENKAAVAAEEAAKKAAENKAVAAAEEAAKQAEAAKQVNGGNTPPAGADTTPPAGADTTPPAGADTTLKAAAKRMRKKEKEAAAAAKKAADEAKKVAAAKKAAAAAAGNGTPAPDTEKKKPLLTRFLRRTVKSLGIIKRTHNLERKNSSEIV
jgi:hypothetical protein